MTNTNQTSTILLPNPEEPIRSELFSLERLEQHAESLAAAQVVTKEVSRGRPLIPRVVDNGRVLLDSYRAIARAIQEEHAITPAAEWLVDNFHIVDEQLREIQDDLPAGYYRKLPKLASGHLQGYPRVFGVAWAFVAHTDSRFDPEALTPFRGGVSARATAHDRRALGCGHHPARGAGGKSAQDCGADCTQPDGPARSRRTGR